ncbi:hypothetical protein [Natronobiforma cellulositropha]|uniref:hypothetical protein n=1 Tax=Natronobiforma cellulositropha TaxID=1679076 RepID=UPI0021D58C9C|nr:hypothetical protein [Natronobiforma cellulositropha]
MTFWTGIFLGEYYYASHELHHFVLGSFLGLLVLGVVVQAVRPSERVGALHSAIIMWVAFVTVFTLAGTFSPVFVLLLGLLVGMAIVHPAASDQLPSLESVDKRLAVVAGVTAVGAITFAGVELNAQLTLNDGHVQFDHYLFMAAMGLSVAGLALYGSARGIGWRYPVYAAASLLIVFGLASIAYPGGEQGSSLGVAGGALVALWALSFVALAEGGETLLERVRTRG